MGPACHNRGSLLITRASSQVRTGKGWKYALVDKVNPCGSVGDWPGFRSGGCDRDPFSCPRVGGAINSSARAGITRFPDRCALRYCCGYRPSRQLLPARTPSRSQCNVFPKGNEAPRTGTLESRHATRRDNPSSRRAVDHTLHDRVALNWPATTLTRPRKPSSPAHRAGLAAITGCRWEMRSRSRDHDGESQSPPAGRSNPALP